MKWNWLIFLFLSLFWVCPIILVTKNVDIKNVEKPCIDIKICSSYLTKPNRAKRDVSRDMSFCFCICFMSMNCRCCCFCCCCCCCCCWRRCTSHELTLCVFDRHSLSWWLTGTKKLVSLKLSPSLSLSLSLS